MLPRPESPPAVRGVTRVLGKTPKTQSETKDLAPELPLILGMLAQN